MRIIDQMICTPFNRNGDRYSVDNHLVIALQLSGCNYFICDATSKKSPNPLAVSPCLNSLSYNIRSIPLHLDTRIDKCLNPVHVKFYVVYVKLV